MAGRLIDGRSLRSCREAAIRLRRRALAGEHARTGLPTGDRNRGVHWARARQGEWRDHGPAGVPGRSLQVVTQGRFDENVERAAAREAHVPGLLVADAIADDARASALSSVLHGLVRGGLDAAARKAAREPAVPCNEQGRTFGPRRGTEGPYDHGPRDADPLGSPRVKLGQQFLGRL